MFVLVLLSWPMHTCHCRIQKTAELFAESATDVIRFKFRVVFGCRKVGFGTKKSSGSKKGLSGSRQNAFTTLHFGNLGLQSQVEGSCWCFSCRDFDARVSCWQASLGLGAWV